MPESVNLQQKLASFDEIYSPKIVGELNRQYVKLVKFKATWPFSIRSVPSASMP